ncbi:MAG TPA: sporulation integral membrane protein YtvI [Candidatus Lachnoclostridium stercorigallinarum]|uniref:Sporulation integral membrane protein YtvI n=1 Tax=Candidatus Lachnoclostridium stercorigallinarum TaxID=2838634 RepID=A0A9D2K4C8_9FIRM|nr:sporulation integral membrane protein YtvI [Candidatus Lachnoclostridium stercorigallinarum]
MEAVKKYIRILLNIIIPVAGIVLVLYLGPKLLRFFLPFVIGWVLAMIANPLVRLLERRVKLVRKHSSMIIVIAVLAGVIGLIYLIVSRLISEGAAFVQDLPALIESAGEELRQAMSRFEGLFLRLPEEVRVTIYQAVENLDEYVGMIIQQLTPTTVSAAGSVAKSIPNILVYSVVIVLSSYFFIVERDGILRFWLKYMPEGGIRYYHFLKQNVRRLVGGYFLAQFRIMFVVAFILAAGLFVLQVKYSFLWAVLISILDFLPVFGTGTVLIPWALIKVVSGEYAFAVGLILIYVLTQVVRQIIQPKIVGDTIGLSPLTTLLFLYLGYRWAGLGGMIIAVPAGMLVLNLYEFGMFDSLIDNLKLLVHDVNEFRKKKE